MLKVVRQSMFAGLVALACLAPLFPASVCAREETGLIEQVNGPTAKIASERWDPTRPPSEDTLPPGDKPYLDIFSEDARVWTGEDHKPLIEFMAVERWGWIGWAAVSAFLLLALLLLQSMFRFPREKPRWPLLLGFGMMIAILLIGFLLTESEVNRARERALTEGDVILAGIKGRFANDVLETHRIARTLSGALRVNRALEQDTPEAYENALTVLYRYQSEGGVTVCFVLDRQGRVRISSDQHRDQTYQNLSFSDMRFVEQATRGLLGTQLHYCMIKDLCGYYAAYPVYDESDQLIGITGAMTSLENLETLMAHYAHCFLVNSQGRVFTGSRPALKNQRLWPAGAQSGGDASLLEGDPVIGELVQVENHYKLFLQEPLPMPGVSLVLLQTARGMANVRVAGITITGLIGFLALLFTGIVLQKELNMRQIRESEEKYRALVENANSIIMRIDREARITFFNEYAQTFFGYRPVEILGKRCTDTIFPERDENGRDMADFLQNILWQPDVYASTESENITRSGTRVHIAWTFRPVLHPGREDEDWTEMLCVGNDITRRRQAEDERKKLEDQVRHVQKLESLGILAGGIAHDFNNLLMGVLGNASMALMDLSPTAPARESILHIEKAASRAAELTKQLLAYSGRGRFVVEPLNLSQLVEDMANLMEISISKKVILKYHLEPNLPTIRADATQIRQVVMNLITNASEAIDARSGLISIGTGLMDCTAEYLQSTYIDADLTPGSYVYMEVSDTGHGMDEETLHRIFDPFYTTKFTGRGLGLAAVLGIVRGHNGAVKVYSEVNRGTTFKILFPVDGEEETEQTETEAASGSWTGSGTVLLADDEETVRILTKKMLERLGFSVLVAADGRDAVDRFREHTDDIAAVLLDMTMPHMGGEEAFREIKQIRADIPVVLSSGFTEQEAMDRFHGKGLAGFIQKPYRLRDLSAALQTALGEAGAESDDPATG